MPRPFPILASLLFATALRASAQWYGYAGNPQHTAISTVAADSLSTIAWTTLVDQSQPQGSIYIHYGSPVITAANTVVVPVRDPNGAYLLEAHNGSNGSVLWTRPTNFVNTPNTGGWVPSFGPTLNAGGALYYQGAGGTVYRVADPNNPSSTPVQISFLPDYATNSAQYNASVFISTPLTSDAAGDIYFGFDATGAPNGLASGIARIAPDGTTTYISADQALGINGASGYRMGTNTAPALSNDGKTLYVGLQGGGGDFLAAIDATTLQPEHRVALSGSIINEATSSPTVGPDGHVYFGVMYGQHYRGNLEQFSGDLSQTLPQGSFGWDITPSVIPASMVPSYHGASTYLLLVKYNDYKEAGGDGNNKMAILDPNDTQPDFITGQPVMKEILTISGVTPDGPPPAVTEWCVNTAAVDPFTDSVLVNSEDGWLYRWNLSTNSFTERIQLQSTGTSEAYTPTLIGPDGTVYAINKAELFALVPEPSTTTLLLSTAAGFVITRRYRRPIRPHG